MCKFCEKSFRLNIALLQHITKNHENHVAKNHENHIEKNHENHDVESIQKSIPTKTKMCDFCDQSFPKEDLVQHLVQIHKINKLKTDIFGSNSKKSKVEIKKKSDHLQTAAIEEKTKKSIILSNSQNRTSNSANLGRTELEPEHDRVRPNSSQNNTENDLFSSENEDEDEDFCKQTADSKCKEYLEKCNAMNNATVNEIVAEDISTENVTNVSSEIDEEEIESNFGNSTGLNFRDENNYGTSGITLGKKHALKID